MVVVVDVDVDVVVDVVEVEVVVDVDVVVVVVLVELDVEVVVVLVTVLLVSAPILKKSTVVHRYKEVILVAYITQIKRELVGGKTVIQNISLRF